MPLYAKDLGGGSSDLPINSLVNLQFVIRQSKVEDAIQLIELFQVVSDDFSPALCERTNISSWVSKLLDFGDGFVVETEDGRIGGACLGYCNDQENKVAHMSILAIAPELRSRGLGRELFNRSLKYFWENGMKKAYGRYDGKKPWQIDFYKKHFGAVEIDGGDTERYEGAIFMSIDLVGRFKGKR